MGLEIHHSYSQQILVKPSLDSGAAAGAWIDKKHMAQVIIPPPGREDANKTGGIQTCQISSDRCCSTAGFSVSFFLRARSLPCLKTPATSGSTTKKKITWYRCVMV